MKFVYKKNYSENQSIREKLAFIEKIDDFPSLPSVVLPLLSKLNTPYVSIKEVEKLINMDPGLVSYVLRLTNSFMFGLLEKVYSVAQSIILIGMSNLRSLVTSYSIRVLCNAIPHSDVQEYLWNHSLSTAVFSNIIARKIVDRRDKSAYTLGLLHDIGKIVLYIHNSEDFQLSLIRGIEKNFDFIPAEKQLFGFSHVEAGYLMIDKLQFSTEMKNVVLYHHNPEYGPRSDKMHWVVSLANELAHSISDNKRIRMDLYLEYFNLSDQEIAEIIEKAKNEIEQYRALL